MRILCVVNVYISLDYCIIMVSSHFYINMLSTDLLYMVRVCLYNIHRVLTVV